MILDRYSGKWVTPNTESRPGNLLGFGWASFTGWRWIRALLLLVILGSGSNALAGQQERPDEQLRNLIKAAINKPHNFFDRFDAEVWLVDMTGRLERRNNKIPMAERMEILRQVHIASAEFHLNPQLVLAVIEIESNFDKFSLSSAGARGLMQVMPFWREEIGTPDDNLFDIATNIRFGCAILSIYLDRERQRLAPALARYNGSYGSGEYPSRVLNAFYSRWFVRDDRNVLRIAHNQRTSAPATGNKAPVKPASPNVVRVVSLVHSE